MTFRFADAFDVAKATRFLKIFGRGGSLPFGARLSKAKPSRTRLSKTKPSRTRLSGTRLAICGFVLAILAGCASSPTTDVRDGYVVDRAHQSGAFNHRVRYLILHYTDSEEPRALRTLLGPNVSSHYLVPRYPSPTDDLPTVWQLVDEKERAWHAGISAWEDRNQLNDTSIGVEIVNAGPLDRGAGDAGDPIQAWQQYPDAQIEAVIALARDIIRRYDLPPTAILGHSDIAPSRKIDPGPRFPWQRLHAAGIGAWPEDSVVADYRRRFTPCTPSVLKIQQALHAYGYRLEATGVLDEATRDVLRAFQMHFRPTNYAGQPDRETAAILWALLQRYRPRALAQGDFVTTATCQADIADADQSNG